MDRRQFALAALAVSPCLASLVAWCSPSAPAAFASRPRAALAFSQYAINWRETQAVPSIRVHFDFRNISAEPLKITGIKPSCGCLITELAGKQRTYEPGKTGRLDVTLPTANEQPGRNEYTITVAYNDGEDRTTQLRFNVDLPAKSIRLEPSELYFYQYGEPLSRTVRVIDDRNRTLDVLDAKVLYFRGQGQPREAVPGELAEATVMPTEIVDGGRRAIPIQVDVAGDIDPAERIAHLVITTSDPDFKTLQVPMLIQPRPKKATPSSVPPVPGSE
jgi:hypothetical protein